MKQTNFTCRVDTNLKRDFLKVAKENDRPASVLIRDFMRSYIKNYNLLDNDQSICNKDVIKGKNFQDD